MVSVSCPDDAWAVASSRSWAGAGESVMTGPEEEGESGDRGVPDATPVRGCPFIDAAAEFPDPESAVHSYAREQKLQMVRLVTALVTELGCYEPAALAEQLVTLADGAASRAMVLGEADYGRHARTAAKTLLAHALPSTALRGGADKAGGDVDF